MLIFLFTRTQLATKYKSNPNVAFGLMNEPHEVDINKWADTLQQVVTGIRNAGAISQMSKFLKSLHLNMIKFFTALK